MRVVQLRRRVRFRRRTGLGGAVLVLALALFGASGGSVAGATASVAKPRAKVRDLFAGPSSSQPLALSANGTLLAVVNPDDDSVTFFDVKRDRNARLATVHVGQEPNGVAVLPNGRKAYVTNTVSGTVSVIRRRNNGRGGHDDDEDDGGDRNVPFRVVKELKVGTEPYGAALTPNGRKLYVTNARSNSVSVVDTATDTVVATIENAGIEPRGIAITNDGDDDDLDETVYVTQFLALPVAGKVDGQDDAKVGRVTVIAAATDTVLGEVTLNPLADTGFKAFGDSIQRIPPGPNATFTTGAYPNQLNNVAIRGNFAYVPNTGASPNGPVRFDVNTHSLLSVIDRTTNLDANHTINMHAAVRDQTNPAKRFLTIPWAMSFKNGADQGFVVSAASNVVVKVTVDSTTGLPAVQSDPSDPTRVLEIPVGKNPRGIVINADDSRAYVMNYVSRDVTVLDLSASPERALGSFRSSRLPRPGTLADKIQVGKELYNTSVGEFDPPAAGQPAITGRMSKNGWGACAACLPNGLSDDVVWIFPSGPKRTIPQHTDFDRSDPARQRQRALNWSAERDEEEDFELNIRAVSGGDGLIVLADGVTQDPDVFNLRPLASGGRNQLKVRGVPAWDAIKAFVQFGIRPPISPVPATEPDVVAGRALFTAANCQQCHGGAQWTSSRINFTPPPDASQIVNGQLIAQLRQVGTFDPTFLNEVRSNGAPSIGVDGFVPPSLLSLFAFPRTFLHNGAEDSLDGVLDNVTHRSAGTGGVDTLTNAADREKVVRFLLSIDASTVPIP
jgi:YVTN family beta-propeller protein